MADDRDPDEPDSDLDAEEVERFDAYADEVEDDEDDEDALDDNTVHLHDAQPDPDEVEADGLLALDRKELSEAGVELDNPEGYADE
jgi:hypothetical protein